MNREEAIEELKMFKGHTFNKTEEALDMAIEALEQEPILDKIAVFEGMTNGEVLQAMFPNASVYEHGSTYSVNNVFNFNSTWWNAEYKTESENEV